MKPKPQEPVLPEIHPSNKPKQCNGSCLSGLFALFCDDIDEQAFCPGEGSCCLTGGNDNKVSATTTMRPTTPVSFLYYLIFITEAESINLAPSCSSYDILCGHHSIIILQW